MADKLGILGGAGAVYLVCRALMAATKIRADRNVLAAVVDAGDPVLRSDGRRRGRRGACCLMVEGGNTIYMQFPMRDLADEIRFAIASFFVGDASLCAL